MPGALLGMMATGARVMGLAGVALLLAVLAVADSALHGAREVARITRRKPATTGQGSA